MTDSTVGKDPNILYIGTPKMISSTVEKWNTVGLKCSSELCRQHGKQCIPRSDCSPRSLGAV